MDYICITDMSSNATTGMTDPDITLLSTQATYRVWVWKNSTEADIANLQSQSWCQAFVTVTP